jgi:DNA helicase-2/ATP-dependent DNA helicase PcrA
MPFPVPGREQRKNGDPMDIDDGSYILEALNKAQREAVEHTEGPLLVFAGPGTGKTRMVVHKIAHLIKNVGHRPDQVLALTFSESAAQEMKDRVRELLPAVTGVRVSTFHSFCNELIRDHSLEIGINMNSHVIQDEHKQSFFYQNVDRIGLETLKVSNMPLDLTRSLVSTIARLKQENVSLERLESYLEGQADEGDDGTAKMRDVAKAYALYEAFKSDRGLLDFEDMQHLALWLLRERPEVLERLRQRYSYIIVDEFQDTDFTQLQVLLLLASGGNVTVVGDDDQSIYRFRGAYLTNVHEFRRFFEGHQPAPVDVVLTRNYRCTHNIQSVATDLIRHNPERQDKQIDTKKGPGENVLVSRYEHDTDQARGIVARIRTLMDNDVELEDIAILVRRRVDAVPITEALERARIPFEVLGSRDYFRHPTVRATLSYLRALHDPSTHQPALSHAMLRPVHGIGPDMFQQFSRYAKDRDMTLWEALEDLGDYPGDGTRLRAFHHEMVGLARKVGEGDVLSAVRAVLFGKDLFRVEIASGSDEGVRRLSRFFDLTSEFTQMYPEAGLEDLLRYMDTLSNLGLEDDEREPAPDRVHLMTIHGAKGREFPVVFIPCLSAKKIPARYITDKIPIPQELWDGIPSAFDEETVHLHEERRLLYVGITRGKDMVFLSLAKRYGTNKGETDPSQFLAELMSSKALTLLDESPAEEEDPRVPTKSVEQYLHHKVIGDLAHGDWQSAVKAIAALAAVEDRNYRVDLTIPGEVDLVGYVDTLEEAFHIPDSVHAHRSYYSPTRLRSYEECPARYRYNYVLGIPEEQKTFWALGTVVHEVIEQVTKRYRDGGDVTEDQALQLLDEAWTSSVYETQEKERQDREEAERMVHDFLVRQGQRDTEILGIEHSFDIDLDGRRVRGKIDRIDAVGDALEVIDYKTGSTKTTYDGLKEDFQMVFYCEGAERAFDRPVTRTGHWYLKDDKERMVEISPEQRAQVLDRAREVIGSIEAGAFPARPDYWTCRWCSYAALCDDRYR